MILVTFPRGINAALLPPAPKTLDNITRLLCSARRKVIGSCSALYGERLGTQGLKTADPLWELSSFSEAAKAAALLVEVLPDPPLSQASQLPHLSCVDG